MKSIYFALLLVGCSHLQAAPNPTVFGTQLSLEDDCSMVAVREKAETRYTFGFEKSAQCRLVTHQHTSIVKTYFIGGAYIFFVENNHQGEEHCFSEYTAFGVTKEGNIKTTPLVKRSGSCFQDKELTAFEYFASKLNAPGEGSISP